MAPKQPHFPAKAKRVIFLYMTGGVSHVDSFDPKPKLTADHGQESPQQVHLVRSPFAFKHYGQSGTRSLRAFPHVGTCVDDLCVIRSMKTDHNDHFDATLGIHTGSITFARPSIGSWVSYGLGTMNQNLPSFIVLAPYLPYAGGQVWGSDFLPGVHQGTRVVPGAEPIPNMTRRAESADAAGAGTRPASASSTASTWPGRASRPVAGRPHQVVRDRLRHAAARPRGVRPLEGDRRHAQALRPGARADEGLRLAVPGRPPAGRARRALHRADRHRLDLSNNWDSHGDMQTHVTAGEERRPADRRRCSRT